MYRFKTGLLFALLIGQSIAYSTVTGYFNGIKTNPNALYAFLKKMPKGGELHYHLAGGAYPETMLALAAQDDYCLDKKTWAITKTVEHCSGIKARELTQYPSFYNEAIRAWSMKNFVPGQESGHDHFFASFNKFMPVIIDYRPALLAEIMQRAANQNELYLEIMILPDNAQSTLFSVTQPVIPSNFTAIQQQLLTNNAFQDNIQLTIDEATRILKQARQDLDCEKNNQQAVCELTVKFQYYILREQPLEKVFAQALNGFAAASRSPDIIGVNLVQPEDGIIALRDYDKQMQIFNFLHQAYPTVHIALHAGELAPSDVIPENLRFHIHNAIHTGQAQRIGHGVAIAFEDNAEELLANMAKKQIAVEINLISNKAILNISGKNHPLTYYLAHKVPVVLSTDDEGILRTDLTHQYVDAALNHGVDYPTLKMITRNSLTYSFLAGKSIWADTLKAIPLSVCQDFNSTSCQHFIKENEKAKLQVQLEKRLASFEEAYIQPFRAKKVA
ncbi:adenosine deaminase family protein [Legionella fairfieldensis]|uniref:adenosine deaminase family protein n=1 Tax=Legionella fairfieldensis TaxID=45064 RepID=UPI000686F809|nr:adenosine deaminase [Legionella fairfieldensis]